MNNRIKEAFESIHVNEEFKLKTVDMIGDSKAVSFKSFVPVAACLIMCFFIYQFVFVSVNIISLDINPSIELGINRMGYVIDAKAYNEDGEILLDNVDVGYKKYKTAIEKIISCRQIQDLLDNNEELVIAVSGQNENGCERIVQSLSDCTQRRDIYCHSISADIVSSAHDNGLSCGRYEAYLNAKEYYPELTVQEALNMTMKELHELCGTENSHRGNHHRGNHNNK